MNPQAGPDRRLSILFVSPFCAPFVGGASSFLDAMASRLAADGHRVTIITTDARQASDFWVPPRRAESRPPARETRDGVLIERLMLHYPAPAPYRFGVLRRLSHRLGRTRLPEAMQRRLLDGLARSMPPLPELSPTLDRLAPDADLILAIDGSWDGMFTAAGRAAARYGRPLVVMPLMHLGAAGVQAFYQMPHQVALYRSAAAVLALSMSEADVYATLGASRGRVHIVSMGVDTAAPIASPHEAAAFRERLGVHGSLVAFLGANTYDKGVFTLAEAVARLNGTSTEPPADQPVTLVCAGPLSQLLEAHVAQLAPGAREALAGRFHVLGVVDEPAKRAILAACDLLALPSRVDAFGIVILEAWLNGKPVIGADAGGIPELVIEGETGLLTPFGDPAALADAIRRLTGDRDLAARLGRAGRLEVHRRFTWEHSYESIARVFDEVLDENAGR